MFATLPPAELAFPPVLLDAVFANGSAVTVEPERADDATRREALLDRVFGPARFLKTCQRLRVGRQPASGLALAAVASDVAGSPLVGTVRLWDVAVGARALLMLGPLGVDPAWQGHGVGSLLMREACRRAALAGHAGIMLVGDAPFYGQFGFAAEPMRAVTLPGPVDRERLLGLALVPGAFDGMAGRVRATGLPAVGRAALPLVAARQAA